MWNLDLATMNLYLGKLEQFCSLNYFYLKIIEEKNRFNSAVFIYFERKKLCREDLKTKNH